MSDEEIFRRFYERIADPDRFQAYKRTPVLAHYTSLEVLEKILRSDEIWYSNPSFMNDREELTFGIANGVAAVRNSDDVKTALTTEKRCLEFWKALDDQLNEFEVQHLPNTYIHCLSEHAKDDFNGLLSMWRGYGANGRGVALVFDTSKMDLLVKDSPLVLAPVKYGSTEERKRWLSAIAGEVATAISAEPIPDEKLDLIAQAVFARITYFAIFTKHHGFSEEKEWRIAYVPTRDTHSKLEDMAHYLVGPRGIEPKLRVKFEHIPNITPEGFALERILHAIVLGPSTSSKLAERAAHAMLKEVRKEALKGCLHASSIPFRST